MEKIDHQLGAKSSEQEKYNLVDIPLCRQSTKPEIENNLKLKNLTPSELCEITHEKNIKYQRQETINLSDVQIEGSVVDKNHAQELGKSMEGDRGQIIPICVRARKDKNNEKIIYDIIDGFHRTSGAILSGKKQIEAIVIYNCPEEELFDLRILAVNSVKSVQFARLIKWVNQSFDNSKFAQKGLTVFQAFSLAINNSGKCRTVHLNPDELKEVKNWVYKKAEYWNRTIGSIYQDLIIANMSAPDLVDQVRTVSGGSVGSKVVTKEKLKIVSEAFPYIKYYPLQRKIINFANEHKLESRKIKEIIENLKKKDISNMSTEEIDFIMNKTISGKTALKASARKSNPEPTQKTSPKQETEEEQVNSPLIDKLNERIRNLENQLTQNLSKKETYKKTIEILSNWIFKTPGLSEKEKRLAFSFFYQRDPILQVHLDKMGIPSKNNAKDLIISAVIKKAIKELL
ncbi:MAG: ParB N-terminal domain-containing protein [Candidatus Shapirobacteria bacterium]|nr:ParB N-terminal domain-containing protein [Candidatus Shapirobacteria bacterium]